MSSTIDASLFRIVIMARLKKSVEIILSSDDEKSDDLNIKDHNDPESDDDDDDEEESLHLPTPPATTRKRKRGQKEKEQVPEMPEEITYMLTLTSVTELKKAASKRKTKSANIRLNSDEPFDTFKAQVLVKIGHALKPRTESIANYELRCTINCVISKPGMDVESEEDYTMMVESALKSKSPHIVNICVEEIERDAGANKENEQNEDSDDYDTGKKKKKKKQPPVYAANNEKMENVRKLREEWSCKKSGSTCGSTYCFIDPKTDTHIPLSHEHFDAWGMAMMNPNGSVTLHQPPNNKLFDPSQTTRISPVVQHRKAEQAAIASSSPSYISWQ
ncbi:hypothetical protein PILCRDRAFT_3027 [Piloderma croceum F 1598]|uniref:Uncharacterized protein n=1 Tax=Piloderma croceum (strain F 1598) TaxID=765440 RepID=A0A0C3CGH5_PILCF|nr:hypothetical protein PILCRDRAFT_3027 [Piloderma croceum F 1598]